MTYEPTDTYLPSASGGAQVPQLVGQRVEAARAYAASAGWSVHERTVPAPKGQPSGFVVRQEPSAGAISPRGAVLLVDVAKRTHGDGEWSRAVLGGVATAAAVVAGVFASLWLSERADHDTTRDQLDAARDELEGVTPAPDWVGGPRVVVDADAARNDWVVVVQQADPDDAADAGVGTVVSQLPVPGTPLAPGSVVVVTVVGAAAG
ncbi:MAG: PASTA domain-containing protein [Acidimicrobiales bacterium]